MLFAIGYQHHMDLATGLRQSYFDLAAINLVNGGVTDDGNAAHVLGHHTAQMGQTTCSNMDWINSPFSLYSHQRTHNTTFLYFKNSINSCTARCTETAPVVSNT